MFEFLFLIDQKVLIHFLLYNSTVLTAVPAVIQITVILICVF